MSERAGGQPAATGATGGRRSGKQFIRSSSYSGDEGGGSQDGGLLGQVLDNLLGSLVGLSLADDGRPARNDTIGVRKFARLGEVGFPSRVFQRQGRVFTHPMTRYCYSDTLHAGDTTSRGLGGVKTPIISGALRRARMNDLTKQNVPGGPNGGALSNHDDVETRCGI